MEIWPKSTKKKSSRNEMSQKSLWAKFPRAIYAFLLGLLDGKAALESTPSRFGCLNGHPSTRPIQ